MRLSAPPAWAGVRRSEVTPKADALSNKPRREVFQGDSGTVMIELPSFCRNQSMRVRPVVSE